MDRYRFLFVTLNHERSGGDKECTQQIVVAPVDYTTTLLLVVRTLTNQMQCCGFNSVNMNLATDSIASELVVSNEAMPLVTPDLASPKRLGASDPWMYPPKKRQVPKSSFIYLLPICMTL